MSKIFVMLPQSEWAMAPSLICSAKELKPRGTFEISILHPNTKAVLYSARVKAANHAEALDKAKEVKKAELQFVKTAFEEIKFIPRPKRGKMTLKTKTRK